MNTQNQSDREKVSGADDDINRAMEIAEDSRKHFQQIALLKGIMLDAEAEVFPEIRLVPFPPSLGKKGQKFLIMYLIVMSQYYKPEDSHATTYYRST